MLKIDSIDAKYGGAVHVLHRLSLEVPEGKIVALLGANGAGKSTTLKSVSGLIRAEHGAVTGGSITFRGEDLAGVSPEGIVRKGIFHVMEGRRVFEELTVEENIAIGAYTRKDRDGVKRDRELVYSLFPRLRERRKQKAGYLSGGEQQMLAISRGLMAAPKLLLLDEPSLGIAPLLAQEIFLLIGRINREQGTAILLVEQNAGLALGVADLAYIMEGGRAVLSGTAGELKENSEIREFYLGFASGGERKGYRHLKGNPEERRRHAADRHPRRN
jgi:branched-chain amino acid transport system ATP-binding protein